MTVINQKIEDAQKAHDEHCKMLDEKCEADKAMHQDSTINQLVGKFV